MPVPEFLKKMKESTPETVQPEPVIQDEQEIPDEPSEPDIHEATAVSVSTQELEQKPDLFEALEAFNNRAEAILTDIENRLDAIRKALNS